MFARMKVMPEFGEWFLGALRAGMQVVFDYFSLSSISPPIPGLPAWAMKYHNERG
jgi:hypothetical protein